MEFDSLVTWFSSPIQIAFLDLVLGADNAVIIALVCRTLPRRQRMNVMIVGTGAALLLRLLLTAVTGALMFVPLLRLAGALVLVLIAVGLVEDLGGPAADEAAEDDGPDEPQDAQAASEAFWDAILLVVLADGVMSLDNTVALAAVAKGDVLFLILGLALSVPMLVFGSWLLTDLLGTTPLLARLAMAVLGWVAGDMAVSDPLVADWIATEAPALTTAVPIAAVIFVLVQSAFASRPRPEPRSRALVDQETSRSAVQSPEQPAQDEREEAALPSAHAETAPAASAQPAPVKSFAQPQSPVDGLDPADDEADETRSRDERLLLYGLGALVIVAAILISLAIFIGGEAQF